MKNLDSVTGNKVRTLKLKTVLDVAKIPTFNKMRGSDFIGRLGPFD